MKFFHERNDYVLDHEINKTFEEILWMTDEEFYQWIIEMRKVIAYAWDELGLPPKVGPNEKTIQKQFKRLSSYPVHEFEVGDDIVRNTQTNLGMAVNSWFPTMMKTTINNPYGSFSGKSIYQHFVDDSLIERCFIYGHRHFKRDSFYHYSRPIYEGQFFRDGQNYYVINDPIEFLIWFEDNRDFIKKHDYWLKPVTKDNDYTGYSPHVVGKNFFEVDVEDLPSNIPWWCKTIMRDDTKRCRIMLFEKGQKIFPLGFKAFRISWCQYPVNFPPLTAKLMYERFTERLKDQDRIVVYDPSMGWAGRLVGALSVRDDRQIHYIGTDPNEDHIITLENGEQSTKYDDIGNYFNRVKNSAVIFPHYHTFETWMLGSEEIHNDERFQKYRGEVDLVFTSPPYFNREGYSDDETQSYKKFPQYDLWRDGFLFKTLETCYQWLKRDRYLLWNISDIQYGAKKFLPLVDDSIKICEKLGFVHERTLKLIMAQMPGQNRVNHEEGKASSKYFVELNGLMYKYEPILVFYKR